MKNNIYTADRQKENIKKLIFPYRAHSGVLPIRYNSFLTGVKHDDN